MSSTPVIPGIDSGMLVTGTFDLFSDEEMGLAIGIAGIAFTVGLSLAELRSGDVSRFGAYARIVTAGLVAGCLSYVLRIFMQAFDAANWIRSLAVPLAFCHASAVIAFAIMASYVLRILSGMPLRVESLAQECRPRLFGLYEVVIRHMSVAYPATLPQSMDESPHAMKREARDGQH